MKICPTSKIVQSYLVRIWAPESSRVRPEIARTRFNERKPPRSVRRQFVMLVTKQVWATFVCPFRPHKTRAVDPIGRPLEILVTCSTIQPPCHLSRYGTGFPPFVTLCWPGRRMFLSSLWPRDGFLMAKQWSCSDTPVIDTPELARCRYRLRIILLQPADQSPSAQSSRPKPIMVVQPMPRQNY